MIIDDKNTDWRLPLLETKRRIEQAKETTLWGCPDCNFWTANWARYWEHAIWTHQYPEWTPLTPIEPPQNNDTVPTDAARLDELERNLDPTTVDWMMTEQTARWLIALARKGLGEGDAGAAEESGRKAYADSVRAFANLKARAESHEREMRKAMALLDQSNGAAGWSAVQEAFAVLDAALKEKQT